MAQGELQFGVLGPLTVEVAGDERNSWSPQQRRLLSVFALMAGRPVPLDSLYEVLWLDDPPRSARKSLQIHLTRLRHRFEDCGELFVTAGDTYSLRVDPDLVDALRFERMVKAGRAAFEAGQAVDASESLRDALDLWRGDPVPDLEESDFGRAEQARLGELRLVAFEALVDAELARGRHAAVVPEIEAVLHRNPLREGLWGQLMLALYRSGRQADALRAFQRARDVLVEEIGIEPGDELTRLEAAMIAHDPDLDLDMDERDTGAPERRRPAPARPAETTASLAATPSWAARHREIPLMGRAAEQARLLRAWRPTESGHGCVVSLAGEPGIGKSRLAAELALDVAEQGALVLGGRGDRAGSPTAAVLQLAADAGAPAPGGSDPGATAEHLAAFVRAESGRRPVLVVVDDLDWRDPAIVDTFGPLIATTIDHPVVVVVTEIGRFVDRTVAGWDELMAALPVLPVTDRFVVGGLGLDDSVELLERELEAGGGWGEPIELATLVDETGGNPLYLVELARHLHLSGALRAGSGDVGGIDLSEVGLPPAVRSLVLAGVLQILPEVGDVLSVAAVAGREFTIPAVADALRLEPDEVEDAVDSLIAEGLVVEVADRPGRFAFRSSVARQALVEWLPAARRRRIEQRLGLRRRPRDTGPIRLVDRNRRAGS